MLKISLAASTSCSGSFPAAQYRSNASQNRIPPLSKDFGRRSASHPNINLKSPWLSSQECLRSQSIPRWSCPNTVNSSVSSSMRGLNPRGESTGFDVWFHDAVVEVVKHLQDAPFLHLDFHNGRQRKSFQHRVDPDIFTHPDNWSTVKGTIEQNRPDGFILVQRLNVQDTAKCYGSEMSGVSMDEEVLVDKAPCTDIWGLVVQSKENKRHGCYILKTTRVNSIGGTSTKFSVSRAKCFGPALHKQIESSWLAK